MYQYIKTGRLTSFFIVQIYNKYRIMLYYGKVYIETNRSYIHEKHTLCLKTQIDLQKVQCKCFI